MYFPDLMDMIYSWEPDSYATHMGHLLWPGQSGSACHFCLDIMLTLRSVRTNHAQTERQQSPFGGVIITFLPISSIKILNIHVCLTKLVAKYH